MYAGTNLLDCFQHNIDIPHIRQIVDKNILIGHNGCCQNTKCGIFGSAYGHIAHQRIAAFYNIMFHFIPQLLIEQTLIFLSVFVHILCTSLRLYHKNRICKANSPAGRKKRFTGQACFKIIFIQFLTRTGNGYAGFQSARLRPPAPFLRFPGQQDHKWLHYRYHNRTEEHNFHPLCKRLPESLYQ